VAARAGSGAGRARPVAVPRARIGLSTASVYPENCATAFEMASRLGYDGVEVMVWTDPVTREAGALGTLAAHHGIPVLSVHAPTLLVTQRVWGTDPWEKVDRSIDLAQELDASTVVLHPPFRWQRDYARDFVDGVALRENDTGIRLAVENMFPWRGPRARELEAYLPHWDPVPQAYDNVTLDLSHTATAGSDAMAMVEALGTRLAHLHLADGVGSPRDEHLVPGRGTQPCGRVLETLATQRYAGHVVVEVATRRASDAQRELDLAEALAFARLHLASSA
jgi:sugar phosphate isomerase/epimerase